MLKLIDFVGEFVFIFFLFFFKLFKRCFRAFKKVLLTPAKLYRVLFLLPLSFYFFYFSSLEILSEFSLGIPDDYIFPLLLFCSFCSLLLGWAIAYIFFRPRLSFAYDDMITSLMFFFPVPLFLLNLAYFSTHYYSVTRQVVYSFGHFNTFLVSFLLHGFIAVFMSYAPHDLDDVYSEETHNMGRWDDAGCYWQTEKQETFERDYDMVVSRGELFTERHYRKYWYDEPQQRWKSILEPYGRGNYTVPIETEPYWGGGYTVPESDPFFEHIRFYHEKMRERREVIRIRREKKQRAMELAALIAAQELGFATVEEQKREAKRGRFRASDPIFTEEHPYL